MPRRPHLSALLLLGLVAGCGSDLSERDQGACSRLVSALPHQLAGERLTKHDRTSATWGDSLTLTCGVGRPDGFTATSQCQVVDKVGWFVPADQIGSTPVDVTATTVDRVPRVRVHIPRESWPSTAALVDLAAVVRSQLRKNDLCA